MRINHMLVCLFVCLSIQSMPYAHRIIPVCPDQMPRNRNREWRLHANHFSIGINLILLSMSTWALVQLSCHAIWYFSRQMCYCVYLLMCKSIGSLNWLAVATEWTIVKMLEFRSDFVYFCVIHVGFISFRFTVAFISRFLRANNHT